MRSSPTIFTYMSGYWKNHKCEAAVCHQFASSLAGHRQFGSGWVEHRPDHSPDIHRAGAAGHIDHRHRPQCNGLFPGHSADRTVSFFAVDSFACQPIIGWIADKILFRTIAIFVAAASSFVILFLPFYLHFPILTRSLIFVWGGSVGGYYTLDLLKLGQCFKGSDLTAASSMFVMAYTAGMVVGPLFCSTSMQVAGPAGLLVLPAIVPAFFILLVLKREGAAMPGGNRI